jgi:hypothetical protein
MPTVVPPVTVTTPAALAPDTSRLIATAPTGAVVPPTVIVPVVAPVAAIVTAEPPLTETVDEVTVSALTVTAVVVAAVIVCATKPDVVKEVKPVQSEVLAVIAAPETKFAVSTLTTVALTGIEIAAVSVTFSVSVPAPPSMLSRADKPATTMELKVSLPVEPV